MILLLSTSTGIISSRSSSGGSPAGDGRSAVLLDDTGQQGCIVVVQDNRRGRCMQEMSRSGSGRSPGCRLRYLGNHAARGCRMRRRLATARFRDLVLEHAVRLTATSRLVLPEAWRGRTGLLDFHVAHRARPIEALALLP